MISVLRGRRLALPLTAALIVTLASAQVDPGTLLVATAHNRDAGFAETVILVLQHDRSRSIGLVINRRLGEPVTTVFPNVKPDPLWAGGPVALGLNALVRSGEHPALLPGIHVLSDRRAIADRLARGGTIRVFVGLCSWGPRQLDDEIDRGLWNAMPGTAALIFDPHPETLWRRLAK